MNTAPIVTENYAVSDTRKYKTHVLPRLDEIEEWIKEGYTDYSIADSLGICHASLIEYKKSQIELIETYRRARTEYNRLTYNSIHKKANGMKVQIKKQKVLNDGSVVEYTEEQYIPPDVNAADLDLRNHDEDYKSAKSEPGNLTLIQNNFQLPQLEAKLQQIAEKRKQLENVLEADE
jgi:hypothetical protein